MVLDDTGKHIKYLHDLPDKKVQEKASAPYVALRAALQNFSPFQTSFIRAAGLGFGPR